MYWPVHGELVIRWLPGYGIVRSNVAAKRDHRFAQASQGFCCRTELVAAPTRLREYDAVAPITQLAPNYVKALVVVHHTRKRDPKASSVPSGSVDEALGSIALAGAFDTVVGLTRKEGVLTLSHESRLFESRRWGLTFVEGRLVPMTSSELTATQLEHSAPLQSRIIDVLREEPMSQSELAAQLEVALVSVKKAVTSLHDKGLITAPRRGEKLKLLED